MDHIDPAVVQQLGQFAQAAGVVGLCATAIVAFWRGWIVPASTMREAMMRADRQLEDVQRDRDDWKEIALRAAGGLESAVELADRRRRDQRRGSAHR